MKAGSTSRTAGRVATLRLPHARLWSHLDPHLYDLSIATETDRYTLKVGIRTIAVQGGQILLNGGPVQLNGFARHEDFYASGKGLNLPLMVQDYQLMRWAGALSYRTSHYPYAEEDLRMADRQGFLVIDETPAVSLQFDNQTNMAERERICRQQIDELIARDKNHPCVVMWSVANEPHPPDLMGRFTGAEVDQGLEKAAVDFLHGLVAHARKLDPTRLVTLVGMMGSPPEWQETCDVACLNRYWGWYMGGGQLEHSFAMLEQELDDLWDAVGQAHHGHRVRRRHPGRPARPSGRDVDRGIPGRLHPRLPGSRRPQGFRRRDAGVELRRLPAPCSP